MADRRPRGREAPLDVDALALLFEQPGLGVCLVGADGRVRRVNEDWLRGTGQPAAVVGARFEDVVPDGDDPLRAAWARARGGERAGLPRRRVLLDGRETFWDGTAAPVPGPGGTAVLFSIHRVADEAPGADEPAAVRRSRVLLAAVLENAPTAIAVFGSADRRIRFANRASQTLLDVREPGAPFVGRLLAEAVREPGPLEELVQLVAVSGAPLTDDEYELRLARGTTFWRWSLHPLPAPGDEPDVLLIATEITEQVQARREAEASARRAEAAEATAREAAWRIARLQRVTASMSAALTPDDLGRALVGAALPVTGAAAATVWALEKDGLRPLASTGVPDRPPGGGRLPLDAGVPAAASARGREPIFLGTAEAVDARFPDGAGWRRALGHCALAALPLAVAGRAAGVLVLEWREARPFPGDERELLEAVAAQCAQAVERARLHEETRSARARAERLGETLASLNAGATETEVLRAAAEAALRTLGGFDAAFLGELEPGGGLVGIHETRPLGRNGTRFPLPELPHVRDALAAGRPALFTRAEARGQEGRWMEVIGARATLAVPIVRGGICDRVLFVNYAEGGPLPGADALALAGEVSAQCAVAIERARLLEGERRARERLERLERFTAALSAAVTFADVGRALYAEGLAPLGATAVTVNRRDGERLVLVFDHGLPEEELAPYRALPLAARFPPCDAVRERQALWLEDAQAMDGAYPELTPLRLQLKLGAFATAPLLFRGEAIGALGLGFAGPRRFAPEDRAWIAALCDPTALAMERTRLFEAERAARAAAEAASAEARRTSELQRQLMAVVGHDLRNPLQAISMGARVLAQRGHLGEQDAATLARLASAAASAAGIISDLLDLGRTQQGQEVRVAPAPIDLAALVRRVARELAAEEGRAPDLVAPLPVHGSWDPDRLAQLVRTLAAAARARGGPGVAIELRVTTAPDGAHLAVSDHGPAIPDAELAGIFEPFSGRPPAPGTPVEGGAGLGLFVAREIVRAHGGRLEVRSTERDGTTFEAVLPLAPRPGGPEPAGS